MMTLTDSIKMHVLTTVSTLNLMAAHSTEIGSVERTRATAKFRSAIAALVDDPSLEFTAEYVAGEVLAECIFSRFGFPFSLSSTQVAAFVKLGYAVPELEMRPNIARGDKDGTKLPLWSHYTNGVIIIPFMMDILRSLLCLDPWMIESAEKRAVARIKDRGFGLA